MSTASQSGVPPPKPWERMGSTSSGTAPFRPPSTGATSDVVEASGTAKPGEIVSTSDRNTTVNTNSVGRPLPTRAWENSYGTYGSSNYGGYNSGMYNSGYGSGMYNSYGGGGYGGMSGGIYGSSMYRGGYGSGLYGGGSGMYGGGMYNSGYGGAMGGYGGAMGGYGMGMGGPYGPQNPNNQPPSPPGFWISFLRVMEGVVGFFGRVSFLVDQNTQSVHLFMSALLQLFDRGGMLYAELARFVFRILGIRRKSRMIGPMGPNGLPLPAPDMQNEQKFIEGPKAAPAGAWDNVWGNDANR